DRPADLDEVPSPRDVFGAEQVAGVAERAHGPAEAAQGVARSRQSERHGSTREGLERFGVRGLGPAPVARTTRRFGFLHARGHAKTGASGATRRGGAFGPRVGFAGLPLLQPQ